LKVFVSPRIRPIDGAAFRQVAELGCPRYYFVRGIRAAELALDALLFG